MSSVQVLRAFHGKDEVKACCIDMVSGQPMIQGLFEEKHGARWEKETGISLAIGLVSNFLFFRMPIAYAIDWPVEFLEAIPVGADLSLVIPKLMLRGIQDVRQYADEVTLPAINQVIEEVLEPRAQGKVVSEDVAEAAAGAAWWAAGASDAVAEAAVDAALAHVAEAVAWAAEAVEDVARSAKAYEWSRWLLELLRDAPVIKEEEEEV